LLSACSSTPIRQEVRYSEINNEHLLDLLRWQFTGRIALSNQTDSWSANIVWLHDGDQDTVNLFGPLRQGAVRIVLNPDSIMIDQGNGDIGYSRDPDFYINQQLGFFIPVSALRYWVTGLTAPSTPYLALNSGFSQLQWNIEYKNFVTVQKEVLPQKMSIKNNKAKLKLVIDEWILND